MMLVASTCTAGVATGGTDTVVAVAAESDTEIPPSHEN
jgi:hypothetical protein